MEEVPVFHIDKHQSILENCLCWMGGELILKEQHWQVPLNSLHECRWREFETVKLAEKC